MEIVSFVRRPRTSCPAPSVLRIAQLGDELGSIRRLTNLVKIRNQVFSKKFPPRDFLIGPDFSRRGNSEMRLRDHK